MLKLQMTVSQVEVVLNGNVIARLPIVADLKEQLLGLADERKRLDVRKCILSLTLAYDVTSLPEEQVTLRVYSSEQGNLREENSLAQEIVSLILDVCPDIERIVFADDNGLQRGDTAEDNARQPSANRTNPGTILIQMLLANGLKADALAEAARWSDHDTVESLIRSGQSVNEKTRAGFTPLMLAASSGSLGMTKFLIGNGANVNDVDDRNGMTAMMWLLAGLQKEEVSLSLAKELWEAGADFGIQCKDGRTVEEFAKERTSKALAKFIASHRHPKDD